MAKNDDYMTRDISFPNQKIVNINLEHEMEEAYIEYAMSVIKGRALPDVRSRKACLSVSTRKPYSVQ